MSATVVPRAVAQGEFTTGTVAPRTGHAVHRQITPGENGAATCRPAPQGIAAAGRHS